MYNIKKAVSRLDFAPRIDEIKVTDIKHGIGIFKPKPDKAASFDALKAALKKAGYVLASAEITVSGMLVRGESGWSIEVEPSKQRFVLEDTKAGEILKGFAAGDQVEVRGDWETVGVGAQAREVIQITVAKPITPMKSETKPNRREEIQVSIDGLGVGTGSFLAPVRTTSPGLTVYKGGAITPRYLFIHQHLGGLEVNQNALRLAVSYTPTPKIQLEAEIPFSRTSFDNGKQTGAGGGVGNITLWGKYRFYRTLETWGDRQAALRFGLELPTGQKGAPSQSKLQAPDFVRQQLSPINGGLAFHADVSYSQAHRRFIYGANVEATLRGERDGFRIGHELRLNTDLEYVLLPVEYQSPGKELFAILETSYSYRNRGRIGGVTVPGTSASEFYLAPGLQFTATPRLVLEASFQLPVVMDTGPLVLRTDKNFLVGIRYLY